jgi:hypothetical protein
LKLDPPYDFDDDSGYTTSSRNYLPGP